MTDSSLANKATITQCTEYKQIYIRAVLVVGAKWGGKSSELRVMMKYGPN